MGKEEFPLKIIYTSLWLITFLTAFDRLAPVYGSSWLSILNCYKVTDVPRSSYPRIFLLDRLSWFYYAASIPLILYCSLLHRAVFGSRYEFLPLMFISVYSALGVVSSWIGFLVVYVTS